jgi:hypothetical protein
VLGARDWEGWVGPCRGEEWGGGTAGLLAGRVSCWENGCQTAPCARPLWVERREWQCNAPTAPPSATQSSTWRAWRRASLPADVQAVIEALKSLEKKKGGLGGAAPHGIKCRACMSEGGRPADGGRPQSGWRARVLMPDDSLHCHSSCLKHPYTPSGSPSSSERAAHKV